MDKDQRTEMIQNLYTKSIYQFYNNYEILMVEVENIGYDATGKEIPGSELMEISKQIRKTIDDNK